MIGGLSKKLKTILNLATHFERLKTSVTKWYNFNIWWGILLFFHTLMKIIILKHMEVTNCAFAPLLCSHFDLRIHLYSPLKSWMRQELSVKHWCELPNNVCLVALERVNEFIWINWNYSCGYFMTGLMLLGKKSFCK